MTLIKAKKDGLKLQRNKMNIVYHFYNSFSLWKVMNTLDILIITKIIPPGIKTSKIVELKVLILKRFFV